MCVLRRYADGFAMMLSVDTGSFDEEGVGRFMASWLERMDTLESLC